MVPEVNIKFRKKDMDKFNRELRRFSKMTAKMPKEVIVWGGIKLLNSLESSTKKSKATRKIFAPKKKKEKEATGYEAITWGGANAKSAKSHWKMFYIQFFDAQGKQRLRRVWATSKEHARHFPIARLWNQGMAKRAWGWARQKLFNKSMTDTRSIGVIKKYVKTSIIQRPFEYGISIQNTMRYALKAFKLNGKMSINLAMSRTVKGMTHQINKRIFGAGFVK